MGQVIKIIRITIGYWLLKNEIKTLETQIKNLKERIKYYATLNSINNINNSNKWL